MGPYELIFEVEALSESVQDAVYENFDALISGHGDKYFVTVSADGSDAISAARGAIARLNALGVRPHRMVEDLVTRSEMARRLGVAAQAVGQWIRGERRADLPFPEPYNRVGGGVWLWADVMDWLARVPGLTTDVSEGLSFPRLDDHVVINFDLLSLRGSRFHAAHGTHLVTQVRSAQPLSVAVTFTGTSTSEAPRERSIDRMGSWSDYGLAS